MTGEANGKCIEKIYEEYEDHSMCLCTGRILLSTQNIRSKRDTHNILYHAIQIQCKRKMFVHTVATFPENQTCMH